MEAARKWSLSAGSGISRFRTRSSVLRGARARAPAPHVQKSARLLARSYFSVMISTWAEPNSVT